MIALVVSIVNRAVVMATHTVLYVYVIIEVMNFVWYAVFKIAL